MRTGGEDRLSDEPRRHNRDGAVHHAAEVCRPYFTGKCGERIEYKGGIDAGRPYLSIPHRV